MVEIANTMRSAQRQLVQADARLYRGLAEELGNGLTVAEEPRPLIRPEGGALATAAELLALKGDALRNFARGGASRWRNAPGRT